MQSSHFNDGSHMPKLIQPIDRIAREKNRDVLFLHFENFIEDQELEDNVRQEVLAWLDHHGISYAPCMGLEDADVIDSYLGDVYIDLAFDETDDTYQLLKNHLEDEHGEMKIEGILFFVLSLEVALDIEAENKANLLLQDGSNDAPPTGRLN